MVESSIARDPLSNGILTSFVFTIWYLYGWIHTTVALSTCATMDSTMLRTWIDSHPEISQQLLRVLRSDVGAAPALSSHAERPVSGRDSTSSAGCLRWRVQSRKRSGGVLTVIVSSSHRDRSNMWRLRGALLLLGTLLESTLGQRVGELGPK